MLDHATPVSSLPTGDGARELGSRIGWMFRASRGGSERSTALGDVVVDQRIGYGGVGLTSVDREMELDHVGVHSLDSPSCA